jgi:hypothetical protein
MLVTRHGFGWNLLFLPEAGPSGEVREASACAGASWFCRSPVSSSPCGARQGLTTWDQRKSDRRTSRGDGAAARIRHAAVPQSHPPSICEVRILIYSGGRAGHGAGRKGAQDRRASAYLPPPTALPRRADDRSTPLPISSALVLAPFWQNEANESGADASRHKVPCGARRPRPCRHPIRYQVKFDRRAIAAILCSIRCTCTGCHSPCLAAVGIPCLFNSSAMPCSVVTPAA